MCESLTKFPFFIWDLVVSSSFISHCRITDALWQFCCKIKHTCDFTIFFPILQCADTYHRGAGCLTNYLIKSLHIVYFACYLYYSFVIFSVAGKWKGLHVEVLFIAIACFSIVQKCAVYHVELWCVLFFDVGVDGHECWWRRHRVHCRCFVVLSQLIVSWTLFNTVVFYMLLSVTEANDSCLRHEIILSEKLLRLKQWQQLLRAYVL